jgi:hypothetical protein
VVALALALAQSGCMTMRVVEPVDGNALPGTIGVGDRISILDTSGAITQFAVTAVGTDFVEGMAEGDRAVHIGAAEIREIRKRRVGLGKTAALGVGVAYLLFMGTVIDGWADWY